MIAEVIVETKYGQFAVTGLYAVLARQGGSQLKSVRDALEWEIERQDEANHDLKFWRGKSWDEEVEA